MNYIRLFLLINLLITLSTLSAEVNDTTNIESIEIISIGFDRSPPFGFGVETMLKFHDRKKDGDGSFYRLLNSEESRKLNEKLSSLLKKDTTKKGIEDNNMDLRLLLIFNYKEMKSPVYIGFDVRVGVMFINNKRYNYDKEYLTYILDYITHKGIKKTIKKKMKYWE